MRKLPFREHRRPREKQWAPKRPGLGSRLSAPSGRAREGFVSGGHSRSGIVGHLKSPLPGPERLHVPSPTVEAQVGQSQPLAPGNVLRPRRATDPLPLHSQEQGGTKTCNDRPGVAHPGPREPESELQTLWPGGRGRGASESPLLGASAAGRRGLRPELRWDQR